MSINNIIKSLIFLTFLPISFSSFSEDDKVTATLTLTQDVSSLACSDEELAVYLDKTGIIDRSKLNKMTRHEFERAYLRVKLEEASSEENLNASECLNLMGDRAKLEYYAAKKRIEDAWKAFNEPNKTPKDIVFSELLEKLGEKIYEGLCKAYDKGAELALEAAETAEKSAIKKIKDKKEENEYLDILTDTKKFDKYLNDITKTKLKDEDGLLKWKDGKIDLENLDNKVRKTSRAKRDDAMGEEVDDIFDDD